MKIPSLIRQLLLWPPMSVAKKTRWKIAGCSLPGTAHLRRGRNCEDSIGWFVDGEHLAIAVADGAGSALHPALGSGLAVRTAVTSLREHHSTGGLIDASNAPQLLRQTTQDVLNTLSARASEIGVEPSDLACTLIIVVANRKFCVAAQIGDGAVVLHDDKGNLTTLTTPINGEFANQTTLLGCNPTIDVQIASLTGFGLKSIAVFTDGLQRLALGTPQYIPHAPFFVPIFNQLQRLSEIEIEQLIKEFLTSPRVNARTDDDKSLVTAQLQ